MILLITARYLRININSSYGVNAANEDIFGAIAEISLYKEVESLTDFSSLTIELQKAVELNENDFTSMSYDKLIGIVSQAQDILYDINATQEDVNQILEQLTLSIDQLVTAGDNSQLMELINDAENLNRDEYTVDSYTILENTLNEAKSFVAE